MTDPEELGTILARAAGDLEERVPVDGKRFAVDAKRRPGPDLRHRDDVR